MTRREAVFPVDRRALYEQHGYSAALRSGDLLALDKPEIKVEIELAVRLP